MSAAMQQNSFVLSYRSVEEHNATPQKREEKEK
jgi:hypothetical protein